jgi:hypothetical protein
MIVIREGELNRVRCRRAMKADSDCDVCMLVDAGRC